MTLAIENANDWRNLRDHLAVASYFLLLTMCLPPKMQPFNHWFQRLFQTRNGFFGSRNSWPRIRSGHFRSETADWNDEYWSQIFLLSVAFEASLSHPLPAEPLWHPPPFCFDSQFDNRLHFEEVDGTHLLSKSSIGLPDDTILLRVCKTGPLVEHQSEALSIYRLTQNWMEHGQIHFGLNPAGFVNIYIQYCEIR